MAPIAEEAASESVKQETQASDAVQGEVGIPLPPKFADPLKKREYLKFRLAQAFRIFGHLGYDEGVAGHITLRDPIRTDCFWVNVFGKHFSLIQPQDLLLVDHKGNVQPESGSCVPRVNKAAFMIHSAIHEARPDVICAAHSHSIYGRAFSTLGKELDIITQDACAFYNDHVVYRQYGGVVLDEEEGKHIAAALGDKKAALLQNHGILVATANIEATVHFYVTLEKCCQVQLLADAAASGRGGETIKVNTDDAEYTYNVLGGPIAGYFSALPLFEALEAREGVTFQSWKAAQSSAKL